MKSNYYEYLQSDWWKQRRDQLIRERNGRCYCCDSPIDLEVHHLTYEHVGMERESELMVLCRSCHKWIENEKQLYQLSSEICSTLSMEQQRKLLNQRRREKVNLGFKYLTGWDIEDIFITECIKNDISNGGTLNLENREVIRDHFETFCKKNNIDLDRHGVGTSKVQMAINPYRYRKILWYYDKNYPKYLTIQQTGFSQSMVYKVYGNPEQYRKIVNETIKEDK